MDAIRKTPDIDISLPSGLSSERVEIEFDLNSSQRITSLIGDQYPYTDRDIKKIPGKLNYYPEELVDGLPTSEESYDITYRTGSNLLLVHDLSRSQKMRELVSETVRGIEEISLRPIRCENDSQWTFVFQSLDQPELVVRDYSNEELVDYEEMEGLSQRELVENHRLDRATLVFEYEGELVHVNYRNDSLSFSNDPSPEAREYVLQLYETYIVENQSDWEVFSK